MECRYGIDGRHGSSASFGSKLLEVVSIPPKQKIHLVQNLRRNQLIREQFIPTSNQRVYYHEEEFSTNY